MEETLNVGGEEVVVEPIVEETPVVEEVEVVEAEVIPAE